MDIAIQLRIATETLKNNESFDIFKRISVLNEDEIGVLAEVLNFTLEGLETGRKPYGPLILSSDKRDFLQEAREELRDGAIYLAIAKLKAEKANK